MTALLISETLPRNQIHDSTHACYVLPRRNVMQHAALDNALDKLFYLDSATVCVSG